MERICETGELSCLTFPESEKKKARMQLNTGLNCNNMKYVKRIEEFYATRTL